MYISLSLMFACGFAAAICTLGVIAAAIIYFRRKKPKTVPFFIGAAVCLVAELIFSKLLLAWVTSRGSYAEIFDTTGKTLLLYSLPAAFFTELFRFFAVKFLHKKRQGHSGARSLGVGSGLCGVFVVVGLFALSNFIMMLLLHTGSFYDTVYPHIGDAEMSAVRAQMDSFTPASFIWLIPVAVARCALHIICTELMYIGISRDKFGECFAAFLFHAAFEILAHSISGNGLEALVLCALCAGAVIYIKKKSGVTVYERNI